MKRALGYLLCVLVGSGAIGSCSTVEDSVAFAMLQSTERVYAVEFPELILTDRSGSEREIKILSVRGRMVTVAPFPYWLLDPVEIPLYEIQSLRVKRKSYPGLNWTLVMMEAGFMTAGGIYGVFAESREQYVGAIFAGLGGAVLGLGYAFYSDIWAMGEEVYPEYDLAGKSEADKLMTILEIMGVF
jgi:hypothetical protein